MQRVLVDSSNIRSIGFKSEAHRIGTLEVEFASTGDIYRISSFPADLHDAWMKSKSKGEFYNQYIRTKYTAKKVEREPISDQATKAATRIRDLYAMTRSIFAVKTDEIARIIDEEWERK
jgi:KTSC domain